jgi:O-antigen biosynthesis protein
METLSPLDTLVGAIAKSNRPRLLFVTHAWGGGVERHVRDLLAIVTGQVDVFVLRGFLDGGVSLSWYTGDYATDAVRVGGFSEAALNDWTEALRALAFERVHIHHLHGWPRVVLDLVERLAVPIDVSLHDYFFACPQYHFSDENGRYCGEPDDNGCRACIDKRPHSWAMQIGEWRETFAEFLRKTDRVIAPTHDVANRFERYFPALSPLVWPHPERVTESVRVRKIVLLGALSQIKGLSVLREVAARAKERAPELAFRLIGHASEPLPPEITTTGTYDDRNLSRLIAEERPDVIWFPFQVPETYSYALSVAIASGARIVASAFGSAPERLRNVEKATLVTHSVTADDWIAALTSVSDENLPTFSLQSDTLSIDYCALYLAKLSDKVPPPTRPSPLHALLLGAPPAPPIPGHSIINLFRLGRYAGHRESFDAVQSQLESLDPSEDQLVGRRAYDAIARHREAIAAQRERLQVALDHASQRINGQVRDIAELQEQARNAARHISHIESEFQRVVTSRSWRWTRPLRFCLRLARIAPRLVRTSWRLITTDRAVLPRTWKVFRNEGVRGTLMRLRREIRKTTRPELGSALSVVDTGPQIAPLALPTSETPTLSIVVPVYEQHATTFACLKSIATHFPSVATEIIVADDASPTPAADALAVVQGVRFIRHTSNLGFIRNINAAAREARGEFLLLLNNDTLLTSLAVDAMLGTYHANENVGLVGAKLLNADGTLQEAGGIVWRDGSAWNYGRGEHPLDPRYNFVRDCDYCSGAALLIRRELFQSLGGFDEYYLPAYYEDTDLAFRVRQAGQRVVYQAHASVYHIEGVSHGRDAAKGVKAHQPLNEKKFRERWQSALASHRENGESAAIEARRSTRGTVLIVEAYMITPDQDSGSMRLLNIMRVLREENQHVVFLAENLEGTGRYRYELEAMGVEVLYDAWAGSVRKVLQERGNEFATIVFCRHYVASAQLSEARRYAPNAKIVFDTVDLHFLREEREAAVLGDVERARRARVTKEEELAIVRGTDATIVVSPVEQALLKELVPNKEIVIVSNIHRMESERPTFDRRLGVIFVGGFRHPPNVDAIRWYIDEVLPHLRALNAEVETMVVGSNMPEEFKSLDIAGIKFYGWVADIKPLLRQARVSVAPLRYGAGVKGKINEAMNFGLPVVATSVAVEGMHLASGVDCLVADDPREFAQRIVDAHTDAALWSTLSANGILSVEKYFSADAARDALRATICTR